ncbi:hypothetical protein SAMN05444747_105397 [Variovorax sp. OV329]|nr:hypothetical protein SAMN05444747_105397 [Variovorax sp. OV329]
MFASPKSKSGVWVDEDLVESQVLYRYMQWEPFGQKMLEQRKLFFCAPYKWTDPYENWWCEQLFRDGSKLADVNAYGWCTTTAFGDEPYWRMYDHSGTVPVVRFTTTVRRLVGVLREYVAPRKAKAYIGRVAYHPSVGLRKEALRLRDLGAGAQLSRNVAHALMLKRTAFRFESEIRATIIEPENKQDHRLVDFEPTKLITNVMLAPSMKAVDEQRIRSFLARAGFGDDKVRHSSIYSSPR